MGDRRVIRGIGVTGRRKPDSELRYPYRRIGREHVHRRIVEQRIGMRLPSTAEVHHVDPNDKIANKGPFVVCQDKAYHKLIERRAQALAECGHAGWRKCKNCGRWDDPANMRAYVSRIDGCARYAHLRRRGDYCPDRSAVITLEQRQDGSA